MSDRLTTGRGLEGISQELLKRVSGCVERICHDKLGEEVLAGLTETAKELVGARSVALVLLDRASDSLFIASAQGLSKQFVKTYRRAAGTGIIGEVLWNDLKVMLDPANPQSAEYRDLKMELEFKSVMCVRAGTCGRPTGFLWADSGEAGSFNPDDLVAMRLLANLAALAVEREEAQSAGRQGETSGNTGTAASYGYFHRRLTEEVERAQRLNEKLSLLLIAADKAVDQLPGDDFFAESARRVKGMMRAIDVMGWYGANHVVMYLPETGQDSAVKAAERFRGAVEKLGSDWKGGPRTVSVGVATMPENGETVEQLMNALTSALFKAQRAGGNRVSGPAEMYVL